VLSERKPNAYRREIWRPKVLDLDLELTVERDWPDWVSLSLTQHYHDAKPSPAGTFTVLDPNDKNKTIAELHIKQSPARNGTVSRRLGFELNEGDQVQLQLLVGERSILGPVIKP
jgi:hypothetical protein